MKCRHMTLSDVAHKGAICALWKALDDLRTRGHKLPLEVEPWKSGDDFSNGIDLEQPHLRVGIPST
jgi:hypothetical protein